MSEHLPPERLMAPTLTDDEEAHLAACAIPCRVERAEWVVRGVPPKPRRIGRYRDDGVIASGGMGEVRAVFDDKLGRPAALKRIRGTPSKIGIARFEAEARVTARLQHPGIVPIYELGYADGTPYYTMKRLPGTTLGDAIRDGTPERRLITVFARACEAVAYAHSRGVVHRDLKPANILIGEFGEVLVVDWGLSRVLDGEDHRRTEDATIAGTIAGTPAYMAPEQAAGRRPHDARPIDVYQLGATLYEILAKAPPYSGTVDEILAAVRAGPPETPPGPPELVALAGRAMARDPEERFPDAAAVLVAIEQWLDGAFRRDRALAHLAEADGHLAARAARLQEASDLDDRARDLLRGVRPNDPPERKSEAWDAESAAAAQRLEAEQAELAFLHALEAARREAPDLPEVLDRLADWTASELLRAEAARDDGRARSLVAELRRADRGRHAALLAGTGTIRLETDPPGADVRLERYEPHARRLVPVDAGSLGRTPLVAPVGPGSWRLVITAPGCRPVLVPVRIGRCEAVDLTIPLPRDGDLEPWEIYVPAGWTLAGPDRERAWVDGFAIGRDPVTNAEYLAFLDALAAEGRDEEALAHAPRERGLPGSPGALLVGREGSRFTLVTDADGDAWQPDWPVFGITFEGASACAAWRGRRLPWEREREKAARGADGRTYPWGDGFDATFCWMRDSHAGRRLPAPVGHPATDTSPYGVRGMAGNARDRCLDRVGEGGARALRGGSWGDAADLCRCTARTSLDPDVRGGRVGFRLARSWPESAPRVTPVDPATRSGGEEP